MRALAIPSSLARLTTYGGIISEHARIQNPNRHFDGVQFLERGQPHPAVFIDILLLYLDGDASVDMIALGRFHKIHQM